jgi:hypothetical protein
MRRKARTTTAAHGAVLGEVRPLATIVVVAALLDPRWAWKSRAIVHWPALAGGYPGGVGLDR